MNISDKGLEFIKRKEGFSATIYADSGGNATLGYGRLLHMGPPNGYAYEELPYLKGITEAQAAAFLREDIREYEAYVNGIVKVVMTRTQYDGLVSFCYNAGPGRLMALVGRSQFDGSREGWSRLAALFDEVVYDSAGHEQPGLVTRRREESGMILTFEDAALVNVVVPAPPLVARSLRAAPRAYAKDPPLPWGDHFRFIGMHDFPDEGVWVNDKAGWVCYTTLPGQRPPFEIALKHVRAGGGLIVRVNCDYGCTIPRNRAEWGRFAMDCANWVRALQDYIQSGLPNSHPAQLVVVVGNEQNAIGEWGGVEVRPEDYADCFNEVYGKVKQAVPTAVICAGAVAWYGPSKYRDGSEVHPRDWFGRMMARISVVDGLCIHAYSHTNAVMSVTSDNTFRDAPMTDVHYDFQNYVDQMRAVPERWQYMPVYLTEANSGAHLAWRDENTGWVTAMYGEVARWNGERFNQQIHAACLFCWDERSVNGEMFGIRNKRQVLADFANAQRVVELRRWVPNNIEAHDGMPYVSQFGTGADKYSGDCGQACVMMLLRERLLADGWTVDQLADMVRGDASGKTSAEDLVILFGRFGVVAGSYLDMPSEGDVVLIRYGQISQRADQNYAALHWVVYLRTEGGDVVVHDPDYRGNGGAFKRYRAGEFYGALHGRVVRVA